MPAIPYCGSKSPTASSRAWFTPPSTTRFSGANVVTTDNSDWATNCPEYKVTAVQAYPVMQPSQWQKQFSAFDEKQQELLRDAQRDEALSDA